MNNKTITLLSGGLDSTVSGFLAQQETKQLYGLTFIYGQRHQKEIESAKIIGKILQLKEHIFFPLNLSQFGSSSLFENSKKRIPKHKSIRNIGKTIPSTYVPARNTIFLSIALAYAETIDADTITIGVTAADYSGYPDCRPEFIKQFQRVINIATKKTIQGRTITLSAPLLLLSKDEIIKKGINLNVPFEKTWSCYQGWEKACGICDACLLRLKGFKNAGKPDPLLYESHPIWYKFM
jgi:7-cyano-7-deazaguanine synthase